MRKGWVFVLGAIVGGAAGWVAGVLSAPRAGQETMNAISEKAIELSNKWGLSGTPVTPQPAPETVEPEAEAPAAETDSEQTESAEPAESTESAESTARKSKKS